MCFDLLLTQQIIEREEEEGEGERGARGDKRKKNLTTKGNTPTYGTKKLSRILFWIFTPQASALLPYHSSPTTIPAQVPRHPLPALLNDNQRSNCPLFKSSSSLHLFHKGADEAVIV